jgi:hypothetical protein
MTTAETIRDFYAKKFTRREIREELGCTEAEIDAALEGVNVDRAVLRAEANRLLKKCPRGRDPVEHERIVMNVFADVF